MSQRLRVHNYRGVELPAVLGLVLVTGGAISVALVTLLSDREIRSGGWAAAAGAALVFGAGLVDDLAPAGPRGIRAHLRALVEGQVSSGIVKLVVVVGCSAVAVATAPARTGTARIAGLVLVASAANLWNGLDVRPGRALKFFFPAAVSVFVAPWPLAPFAPGVALAAALVLPWDARERAMLGDAGANLLGFTAGICLFDALHGAWVVLAAIVGVALNALAETVTLSRIIERVPPLRWYDRLGSPRRG